jgi:glutathione S-transferase
MGSTAKLYVIPGSHPCRAGMLMLEHKGIPYRMVERRPGLHKLVVRARGFPGQTVPALAIDGFRVQTNREIARFLDGYKAEPPLFPAMGRDKVEEAERFADEVLQPLARRLVLAAGMRDLQSLDNAAGAGRLGPLLAHKRRERARIMRIAGRFSFRITPEIEALDLAALPDVLDRVDRWIGAGVLNGRDLNAADFQLAPSICLLTYRPELRSSIEWRPAWDLADRVIPAQPPAARQEIAA